ncbi:MAG: 23S rRNA (uracil(1939)-C(5))-methyltransferase RlmD [Erysipelotrichaceae bacterium]|nr:23S rRNA (uracil(1939)-C(5))-methyltransferase RlmD [Erysipelotrichaceae bacterium]
MKLEIKKIGINGEGIAYYQRKPVFIDNVLPGEVVDAHITEQRDNYAFAKCDRILARSNERAEPKCRYYDECGGCQFQHCKYSASLKYKKQIVEEAAYKYAKEKLDIEVTGAKNIYGYRNELKLPVREYDGELATGMYLKGSNRFKTINACLIHDKELEEFRKRVLKVLNSMHLHAYSSRNHKGLRYLVIRKITDDFQMKLIFGESFDTVNLVKQLSRLKELKSLYVEFNRNSDPLINYDQSKKIYGKDHLDLVIDDKTFKIGMNAFLQLNISQAINIYHYVSSLIDPGKVLVEEYSGIGIMSIMNASKFEKVYASELSKDSIECFAQNIKVNQADNIQIMEADAYKHLVSINNHIDYLLVDPPRSGMDHKMIKTILSKDIDNIIYVSCNPATLFKNIDALKGRYEIKEIRSYDMHCLTAHVETVAKLSKKDR